MESSLIEQVNTETPSVSEAKETVTEVNIYPIIRHLFLFLCVLIAVSIILFLMYQNGKSIYDKGL